MGGGDTNTASGSAATVAGGYHNAASQYATVGGGHSNVASGQYATVPGGLLNSAGGYTSFAAGRRAKANHDGSFVWGDSTDADIASTAANQFLARATNGIEFQLASGGWQIQPGDPSPSLIGGSYANSVITSVSGGTIAGGGSFTDCPEGTSCDNFVGEDYGTVGGGAGNNASGPFATVGGGAGNHAGLWLPTGDDYATVAGGVENTASGLSAAVGGGAHNTASGSNSTVAGGYDNDATGAYSTASGGEYNTAAGYGSTVVGGTDNSAGGNYSLAAGHSANAADEGSFVWADASKKNYSPPVYLNSIGVNSFVARAAGGVRFYTNADATLGSSLFPGSGTWTSDSDRNLKENFAEVDGVNLLERLARVPITTWNYKTQDASIRHIGPMAQDFSAAFAVGEDDTHISTVDADGVSLAAITGLYELVQELQAENASLAARLADLEGRLNSEAGAKGGTR